MAFDGNSTLGDILADEKATAVLNRHIPGASEHPQRHEGLHMTLREIVQYPESGLTAEKLKVLIADLEQL